MLQNNNTPKSLIDKLWQNFWEGGIANPLTAIEQTTYLIFMKRLDDLEVKRERDAEFTGEKYASRFKGKFTVPESNEKIDKNELHWSVFKLFKFLIIKNSHQIREKALLPYKLDSTMRYFTLFLIACPGILRSQNGQLEINEQVWKPFIKTFSEQDADGFMALHSKDLVRSARDGRTILNWDQYFTNSQKSQEREKATNRKRKIDLRFTERIASADQALDVGIYKTTYINPDGSATDFYGKFLVVLRKENGVWKILVDTDSSEGGTIDEKSFLAANKMDN